MTATCDRRFDESLLSGYIDRALTQSERQQVALHVERCGECRALLDEMGALREAARSSSFAFPADEQWNELPRSGGSRALRLGGWLALSLWLALVASASAVGLARLALPFWEKLAVVGGVVGAGGGLGLLLLSVLFDRLRDLRHDRYRRVLK
jgi:anti-sigma factor RsiW